MINIQFNNFGLVNTPNSSRLNGKINFSDHEISIVSLDRTSYCFKHLLDESELSNFEGAMLINDSNFKDMLSNNDGVSPRDLVDYITKETLLITNLNVIENITLAANGVNGKDPYLSLKQFDFTHLAEEFPANLSNHEAITVSIIMAIVRNCELIVLDCLLDGIEDGEIALIVEVLEKCRDYYNKRIIILTLQEQLNVPSSNVYTLIDGSINKSFHNESFKREVTS